MKPRSLDAARLALSRAKLREAQACLRMAQGEAVHPRICHRIELLLILAGHTVAAARLAELQGDAA